jgi:hypothetical protein
MLVFEVVEDCSRVLLQNLGLLVKDNKSLWMLSNYCYPKFVWSRLQAEI